MSADLEDIYEAYRVWEQAELSTFTNIERYQYFKAFKTFPTDNDVDQSVNGPLQFPYTCHWCESSQFLQVAVNNGSTVEDQQVHRIITGLIFAKAGDPLHAIALRDAQWRAAYRRSMLKHLQLGLVTAGYAHSVTVIMGEMVPLSLDLYNQDHVGIQIPTVVTVRIPLPTAVG